MRRTLIISAIGTACGLIGAAIGLFVNDMNLLLFGGFVAVTNVLIIGHEH